MLYVYCIFQDIFQLQSAAQQNKTELFHSLPAGIMSLCLWVIKARIHLEKRRSGSGLTVFRSIYIERGISGYWRLSRTL